MIQLKKKQRRGTKMIRGLASLLYDQGLRRTNLISQEMRRQRADLVEVYKTMHGLEDLPSNKTK